MDKPLVSICCITYNHELYIRDCLEGFMMQQTSFPFEVLIHDDASTDHTADIIREYETKYPDIIKPIYQTENQYSKGVKISFVYNYPRAQGKYIATCEGDDYWIDPLKLQKQFDFMEAHPDYSMCGTRCWSRNDMKAFFAGDGDVNIPYREYNGVNIQYLFQNPFATASYFFKYSDLQRITDLLIRDTQKMPFGDLQLVFHLSQIGKIGKLSDRTTVYRIHRGSASQYGVNRRKGLLKFFAGHVILAYNNGCFDAMGEYMDYFYSVITAKKSLYKKFKEFLYSLYIRFGSPHRLYNKLARLNVMEQVKFLREKNGE